MSLYSIKGLDRWLIRVLYYPPGGTPLGTLPSNYSLNSGCVYRFVEMSDINDDEVPCCSKDVRREDESLLQKFVPVNVFSDSSVRRMMSQDVSTRRVTTLEGTLNIHVLTHTDIRRFQCDLCEYKTTIKHCLTQHLLIHTGERPFTCDQCDYSTTQKGHLMSHKRSHTGEKPYLCTLCEYKTSHSTSLTNHMSNHTGYKPFACSECAYKTVLKTNLTPHMRTHTNEKPFGCEYCTYRSAQRGNLNQHMKRCRKRPST